MNPKPQVAFLNAVDWVVPDAAAAAERLADLLPGLVVTGDLELPTHGFATVFHRSEASMGELPTRIQFVTLSPPDRPADHGCWVAPFTPMQLAQGYTRQQRVHGTVLVVTDFDSTRSWLADRGIPHYIEQPCSHLPYQRIWVGWNADGAQRDHDVDGGIFLEFIPIEVFPSVVRNSDFDNAVTPDVAARVIARTVLVPDVAAASQQLEQVLGRGPDAVYFDETLGLDGVTFRFAHSGSAELVLASPRVGSLSMAYLEQQGPGSFLTTFRVRDLNAVRATAAKHGFHSVLGSGAEQTPEWLLLEDGAGIRIQVTGAGHE